ncbi:lipid A export permease/ATP-binding protein MsbA [Thalassolituus oleivorans]|uniref:lipid A export permease/ATP-binding protein MsbA n=1 Tax=Thalassolituus oleivorans TaxID=187493 RepID=UPI00042DC01E|nr:lipid A export permease/ATP-binding protein MsbA [Thalassolituus oleivorans]AHK15765.1 ATP-binding protein [Thalassolituus oleivorans R6-15]APR67038.1 lipid A export permease/ATP-binding protein MsbA [Thalassolituus oleivorans]MCA6129336.1 lipid transporter ATP-binding/permease [Thalassolituus oleivorans 4BN06-13]MDF1641068.1 lipid A export permease/ATP-binding protein MsbA [Thalassolituus oleivorans]
MSQEHTAGRLYRRLLTYVWPHRFVFAVSILGFLMFASSAPALAHLMGVVEKTLQAPTQENIIFLVAVLFGVYLYRGVGTFLGKYFTAIVGREVVHALRTELFGRMLRLPSRYYDGESTGRLISRVIFDVEQVNGASTRALTTVVQEGATVVLLMGYLIWLDYTLTGIFLVIVPVMGLLVSLASKFFRRYSRRIQKSVGEVTQITNESISGYREVRTYGATEYEEGRFAKASDNNRRQVMKFELTNAISVPVTQQVIALGLGVMVYLMFQRVAAGSMTSEAFLQFITAASLIAKPIRALTDINSVIQKGLTAAESIFLVLDADIEKDTGTEALPRAKGVVSFKHTRFRYDNAADEAVKGVDLDIPAGTSVAFVGRSGSGKTTLVNLLPRFYEASGGEILIDGHDIQSLTLDSLRDQIAIVSQQVTLFNSSIRDNIAYGCLQNKTDEEVLAAAKAAHADEFIQKLPEGYATQVGENGVMLSGGQRQRIAIARAILKNAPILILDEATSALDTESERHIQAAMEEVMKGRTTLVIAHRLSTIENVDRIVVIDNGHVVEQGSHADLIKQNGAYAQLHQLQFSEL